MTGSSSLISDRYRLGELLGTGGSASVFAAIDTSSGDRVALKLLHPHLSGRPSAREAFFAEARRAQQLRHPNIVGVLGVGVHEASGDAVAWIALERAEGLSLSEHVARHGALAVAEAVAVADGVLRALEVAHGAGVIHRDVSPANVMVVAGEQGEIGVDGVRLLDFGLADAAGRAALGADILRSDDAVGDAGVIGSVDYLSPEQARGAPVDERGDLYQLGAVLSFALTGRAPFQRATAAETIRAHLAAPPPVPSVMDSRIPRGLDRIVVRAMLKDPDDRFPSAAEMRAAIEIEVSVAEPALAEPGRLDPLPPTATRVLGRTSVPARPSDAVSTAVHRVARTTAPGVRPGAAKRIVGGRPRRLGAWASAIAAVAAVGAILAFVAATPPAATAPPSSAPAVDVPAGPGPSASAEADAPAETVDVPELAMMSLAEARDVLKAAGLVAGTLSVIDSGHAGDTVLASAPGAGTRVDQGSVIGLTVASGFNRVPETVGMSQAGAAALLESAGFAANVAVERSGTAAAGTVLGVEPHAGTVLRIGTTVTIVVAASAEPAPTPAPTPSPTPTPTPTPAPTPGPPGG
ncbi:hypothetical protein DCE93_13010 [Agromyces badenianii]|uniref:non-specific serine/threonine protein kinase n=1 Tax=Agromyces badenianii TaxID=2080742 RepID=A0A2S0WYL8_9MICO|nr:PASTA domain-containing protein [Agromyces badenianii]AWB96453.1 hypothetical protein DCE93_13010 [Agromyces badenianii]